MARDDNEREQKKQKKTKKQREKRQKSWETEEDRQNGADKEIKVQMRFLFYETKTQTFRALQV